MKVCDADLNSSMNSECNVKANLQSSSLRKLKDPISLVQDAKSYLFC